MQFVAQSTQVRIPKLYATFTEVATGMNFIVMEYIPGTSLSRCWASLEANRKEVIVRQLRHYFDELRSLPAPDHFASIDGSGLRDPMFTPVGSRGPPPPPFKTVEEMVRTIVDCVRSDTAEGSAKYGRDDLLHDGLLATLRGYKPVFTHGDLNFGNIVVPKNEEEEVVVIDWAYSGWYPAPWDTGLGLFASLGNPDDRYAAVRKITGDYVQEFAWLYLWRYAGLVMLY